MTSFKLSLNFKLSRRWLLIALIPSSYLLLYYYLPEILYRFMPGSMIKRFLMPSILITGFSWSRIIGGHEDEGDEKGKFIRFSKVRLKIKGEKFVSIFYKPEKNYLDLIKAREDLKQNEILVKVIEEV